MFKISQLRRLWLGLLVLLIIFFVWVIVRPTGQVTYGQDFQDEDYQRLGKLKPLERTLPPVKTGQTILGGPLYFTLNAYRPWKKAEVTVQYRTSPNFKHSQIELGLLVNKAAWQYIMAPLENKTLDAALGNWVKVASGSELLLQRQARYSSLADFRAAPPKAKEIGIYNNRLAIEPAVASSSVEQSSLSIPLVGGYQFFTYINKGSLSAHFAFNELNNPDLPEDQTFLRLYRGQLLLKQVNLSQQRDEVNNFGWWVYELNLGGLEPGYYKIELRTDKNLLTKSLEFEGGPMSFVGPISLGPTLGNKAILWTTSRELNILAETAASVGTIVINDQAQEISAAFKQFSFQTKKNLTKIKLIKPSLTISGDGVFAFEPAELLEPRLRQVDYLTDLDREGINYILANYSPPLNVGGWQTATATFDFTAAVRDADGYKFMLSIPGFKVDDQVNDWLEIKNIQVKLTGRTLWQIVTNKFKTLTNKVFLR